MRSKRLMRTNTSVAQRAALLKHLGDSFDVAMMFVNSFDVATTVMLDVL